MDIPGRDYSCGYPPWSACPPQSAAGEHRCSQTTLLVARSHRCSTLRPTCCVEIGVRSGRGTHSVDQLRRAEPVDLGVSPSAWSVAKTTTHAAVRSLASAAGSLPRVVPTPDGPVLVA